MIRSQFSSGRAVFSAALLTLLTMSCHRDRVLAPAQSEQSEQSEQAAQPEVLKTLVTAAIPVQCPEGATKWLTATNGNWLDNTRWSAGIPTAATPACIDLAGAYVVTIGAAGAGTPVPALSLFLGESGAATQPTLRIARGALTTGGDVIVYGKIELAPGIGLGTGASTMVSGRIAVAPSGILIGGNGTSKQFEAKTFENDGTITAGTGFTLRAETFVNRATFDVPANLILAMRGPTSGGGPNVTFEAGNVNAVGNLDLIDGTLTVTGGAVNGTIDLIGLDELKLQFDAGGLFNLQSAGTQVPTTITKLAGTIGPSQHVFLGVHHLTVETPGLVNKGQLTVHHTSACCGVTGTVLRTLPGATLTNEATLTLSNPANAGAFLEGNIVNEATGLIVNVGDGTPNIAPNPLINRGTLRAAKSHIRIVTGTDNVAPDVVLEDGQVESSPITLGHYQQTGGTLHLKGGKVRGTLELIALSDVLLEHDAGPNDGGRFDLTRLGGQVPTTLTQLRGTVGPNQHVWMGLNHLTVRTPGLVNKGQLTVHHTGACCGTTGTVFQTAPGATLLNEGTLTLSSTANSGAVLEGSITNATSGVIVNTGDGTPNIAPNPLTNHGIIRAAKTQIRVVAGTDGTAPEVVLAGGKIESSPATLGQYQQTGGTLTMNGGEVSGTLDFIAVSELSLHHDGGGRFDLFALGGLVPPTTSLLTGTIGATQHVWMGINHLTVETTGLVNKGQITVQHTGAMGKTGTVLQTSPGATLENEGTLLLLSTANSGAHLAGSITNVAGGVILNSGSGTPSIAPNPLINRGTLRSAIGQLRVVAGTDATPPEVVMDGGRLELTGSYQQTDGLFKFHDGSVNGAGASTFPGVRFSGFGTWGRALALTGVSALAPGQSPGKIAITGDYTPATTTVTDIELAGTEPGTGYDQIAVANTARFAGTLRVTLANGFVPEPCQTFQIVTYSARTGTFANSATPVDVGNGMKLRQVYTANALVLVAYKANGPNVNPTEVHVSVDGVTDTYDVCIGAGADVITVLPDNQVVVDKATLTFGASQLPQTVTVSAAPNATRTPGLIKHTASSGTPVGDVTVHISGIRPSDTDAPTTKATPNPEPNAHGWNNSDVTVALNATDDGSGVAEIEWSLSGAQSGGATVAGSSATVNVTAEGQSTLTYFARDIAGNVEAAKTLVVRIDKTRPVVTVTRAPPANIHGWNNTDVTVTFSATDALSGIEGSASLEVVVTNEGANQSATQTFRDRAGNTASATGDGISIDKTAPTVSASREPPPNADGWNNTDVTATFSAADALSGIDGDAVVQVVFTEEGANQSATRTFRDRAGNTASATISDISIDKTLPTISCSATPQEIWPPNNRLVPVSILVVVTDAGSGSAGFVLVSATSNEPEPNDIVGFVIGTPDTQGSVKASRLGGGNGRVYRFEYRAVDQAGNVVAKVCEVRVPHDQGRGKR